jgi:hypothetical protein
MTTKSIWCAILALLCVQAVSAQTNQPAQTRPRTLAEARRQTPVVYQLPEESTDLIIPIVKSSKPGAVTFTDPTLFIEVTRGTSRDMLETNPQEIKPEEMTFEVDQPWVPDRHGDGELINVCLRATKDGDGWLLASFNPTKTTLPRHFSLRTYHLGSQWDELTVRYRTVFYERNREVSFSEEREVRISLVKQPVLERVLRARAKR